MSSFCGFFASVFFFFFFCLRDSFGFIGAISDLAALSDIIAKASCEGVAIRIGNQFADAKISYVGQYIGDGVNVVSSDPEIYSGNGGEGGEFDDGFMCIGGSGGLLRYKVIDPQTSNTYCLDILWSQGAIAYPLSDRPVYWNGYMVLVTDTGCSGGMKVNYDWFSRNMAQIKSRSPGTLIKGVLYGSYYYSAYEERAKTEHQLFNSRDGKIQVFADMGNAKTAVIKVWFGPNGWKGSSILDNILMYWNITPFTISHSFSSLVIVTAVILILFAGIYKLIRNKNKEEHEFDEI